MRQSAIGTGRVRAIVLLALMLLLPACGKKGALTLRSYESPPSPADLSAMHREGDIMLSWSFPKGKEESIAGFRLSKTTAAGTVRIIPISAADRIFADTDFRVGERLDYALISVNARGISGAHSPAVSVVPLQPPPPPERLTAVVQGNAVILFWEVRTGSRYNVYKRYDKDGYGMTPLNPEPLKESGLSDPLVLGKTAHYTVRGLAGTAIRDEGPPSVEATVNPEEIIPQPPKNVRWYAEPDRVVLSWDESPEPWVTGYRVYRRMDTQAFVLIGETQIPTCVDRGRVSSVRDYRVTAVGPAKEGPATDVRGVELHPD